MEIMFQYIRNLLKVLEFNLSKFVAIDTDGAVCMTGMHQRVVARLEDLIHHLLGTHYTVQRETPAAMDASDEFSCLGFIDQIVNKVYEWLKRSVIR